MTRNLKTLGLALVAALALSAVVASAAPGASALFTSTVGPGEQAEIHGEQEGTDTFTVAGLPPLTCATATETGFPEEGGTHKKGPSAPSVTLTPAYDTCHVKIGVLTRTVTVTTNGCTYTFTATKNTGGYNFSADLTINCPNKPIEIHIYNTSDHNHSGATTACTIDVGTQTVHNNPIELTNLTTPNPDHVLAHINATVNTHNTILSGTCGNTTNPTATYTGTHTLRTTKAGNVFVHTTVS